MPNRTTEEQISTPVLDADSNKFLRSVRLSRIALPVFLGVAAVAYILWRQVDWSEFRDIVWSGRTFGWIGLSFLLLIVRHLFYAFRLKSVTGDFFSWKKSIELIVLWEFSAAVTPTSKGGPFVMMFALTKEGLAAGRTVAAVFYTMMCDAGFFVLTLPFWLALYGPPMLYPGMKSYGDVGLASGVFFVTYGLMAAYLIFLVFFLLIRPQYAKYALNWLSQRALLRKWAPALQRLGDEFALAAREIRSQNRSYHLKVIIGAIGAWTCKFIMINCLLIAIVPDTPVDGFTQTFIYARLVAMFTIMNFSPTPGGAGLAEVALAGFISDYATKEAALVVALLWRGMAYYGYLALGALVIPAWIAGHVRKKKP